ADDRIELRQVQVTDPGVTERGEDVDIQAGSLLGQRGLGPWGAVSLDPVGEQVAGRHLGEPSVLGLEPSRAALGLIKVGQQLLCRVQALGRALDLPLEHRIPHADPVDRRAVRRGNANASAALLALFRGDPLGQVTLNVVWHARPPVLSANRAATSVALRWRAGGGALPKLSRFRAQRAA